MTDLQSQNHYFCPCSFGGTEHFQNDFRENANEPCINGRSIIRHLFEPMIFTGKSEQTQCVQVVIDFKLKSISIVHV